MHRISEIEIKNFKSIGGAKFVLSDYTPLVGYNNAGKTNILKAIEWVIKKASLDASDFHNPSKPITVTATISGVTEDVLSGLIDKHRRDVEKFVMEEQVTIRRIQQVTIRRIQEDEDTKMNPIKLEVLDSDQNWTSNPTGIDNAIKAMFPDPIFVGAMENSMEDSSKNTSSSSIGKLIKEIVKETSNKYSQQVEDALSGIKNKISAEGTDRDGGLVELDGKIQDQVDKFFPDMTARIHIPVPSFSEFFKGGTMKLLDKNLSDSDENWRDVSSFGHGAQRSLQVAMIKCLADMKKASEEKSTARTTLLLIDEPELYLHPQAIELVRTSLRTLSSQGYQVVFTTHSPCMISRDDAPDTLIIQKKDEETRPLKTIKEAVRNAIDGAVPQSEILFEMGSASEILFSEKVILVEGKTEIATMPDLFYTVIGESLQAKRIGIVPFNGTQNIPKSMQILKAMGIEANALVDLDFAFRGAIENGLLQEEDQSIQQCKVALKKLCEEDRLELDCKGLPKRGNGRTAAHGFELLAEQTDAKESINNLHNQLLSRGYWLWQKGTVEKHFQLKDKKATEHARFIREIKNNNLIEKLEDSENIKKLCRWIEGKSFERPNDA